MLTTLLPHRAVLEIQGDDKTTFLQGLISNDVTQVTEEQAIYATLLSPQGRFLYDFFIMEKEGSYFLDVEALRLAELTKKLSLYKLRCQVTLIPRLDMKIYVLWEENRGTMLPQNCHLGHDPGSQEILNQVQDDSFMELNSEVRKRSNIAKALNLKAERGNARSNVFMDPRLTDLGARMMAESPPVDFEQGSFEEYDLHRLILGVPEGGRDLIPDKSTLLESGMDELNAISWIKGCYIGQELTTRSKFVGQIRKRLLPVTIEGSLPDFGAEIFLDEIAVGSMRTYRDGYGLALLRLEELKLDREGEKVPLKCGGAFLKPYVPFWMKF